MKTFYTILFFADTLILIFQAFLLLWLVDHGIHPVPLILLITGIVFSIILLAFFLTRYMKIRSPDQQL